MYFYTGPLSRYSHYVARCDYVACRRDKAKGETGATWGYACHVTTSNHTRATANGPACHGGGWGAPVGAAVVGGLAVGAVVGASVAGSANANANANAYAAGAAAATAAYPFGATYGALPHGCGYSPNGGSPYYNCGGVWMAPA